MGTRFRVQKMKKERVKTKMHVENEVSVNQGEWRMLLMLWWCSQATVCKAGGRSRSWSTWDNNNFNICLLSADNYHVRSARQTSAGGDESRCRMCAVCVAALTVCGLERAMMIRLLWCPAAMSLLVAITIYRVCMCTCFGLTRRRDDRWPAYLVHGTDWSPAGRCRTPR